MPFILLATTMSITVGNEHKAFCIRAHDERFSIDTFHITTSYYVERSEH